MGLLASVEKPTESRSFCIVIEPNFACRLDQLDLLRFVVCLAWSLFVCLFVCLLLCAGHTNFDRGS